MCLFYRIIVLFQEDFLTVSVKVLQNFVEIYFIQVCRKLSNLLSFNDTH